MMKRTGDEALSFQPSGSVVGHDSMTPLHHSPAPLSRRTFLRAAGVSLALPMLDAMLPRSLRAAAAVPPQRMICICTTLGLHAPFLFPKGTGRGYESTPYLDLLKEHRDDVTVFSGLSHAEQSGAHGHACEISWLTGAKHPMLAGFRNSISLDQVVAAKFDAATRFPSLALGTGPQGLSYNRSGVMLPVESKASRIFAKLFIEGTPDDVRREIGRLNEGRSVLDAVSDQAKRLGSRVGAGDRDKLDEYFTSVREMEQRLKTLEAWARKPKPNVKLPTPRDVLNDADTIGKLDLLFDMMPLILTTDSTRVITLMINVRNDVPPVPGVTIDHHNLSHHGQDPVKIAQLRRIEEAEMKSFAGLIAKLKAAQEAGTPALRNTTVLFGSNLGNANAHDPKNLPILVAGGGFKHGQHLAFDAKSNTPLGNLFVTLIRRMGVEAESFGSSTAPGVSGFDAA